MFCLDTNIVIYYQNNIESVVKTFLSVPEEDLAITHITRAELFYGAYKSQQLEYNLNLQTEFCNTIEVVNSSYQSDEIFGKLKAQFKKTGKVKADLDLMISSICLANNLTLVTHNTKHFEDIEGLKVEDWVE